MSKLTQYFLGKYKYPNWFNRENKKEYRENLFYDYISCFVALGMLFWLMFFYAIPVLETSIVHGSILALMGIVFFLFFMSFADTFTNKRRRTMLKDRLERIEKALGLEVMEERK